MVSQLCEGHVHKNIDQTSHSLFTECLTVAWFLDSKSFEVLSDFMRHFFDTYRASSFKVDIFLFIYWYVIWLLCSDLGLWCDADWCSFVIQTLRLLLDVSDTTESGLKASDVMTTHH